MLKRVKSNLGDRGKLLIELLIQTATPFGVLLLSLIVTGLAWYQTTKAVERDAQMTFDRQVNEAKNALNFRIQTYINTLRASQGLFAASNSIERVEWKNFVESLKLQKLYPGIVGIGFIRYVPHSQKASYQEKVRQDTSIDEKGYPNFAIKPPGDRPGYFVIEYLEPLPPNRSALGFDVGSEPMRRAAAERARDTGEAAATGQIVLVQDSAKQAGLLILLPVYRQEMPHNTVAEKRRALLGFVYAPLRVEELIEEALPNLRQQSLDLEIYNDRHLIYRSDRVLQLKGSNSSYRHLLTTLDVAGQSWELTFLSQKAHKTFLKPMPILVLFSGVLIGVLLFGITQSLASSRQRALQLATQMTDDLRKSENLLRDFFDSANDLIQSVSLDRKFIFVNQAWKKTLGYSEEEIGQLSLLDILHPDSHESYLEMLQAVLAGSREAIETTFVTKEGRAIAVEGKINCRFENGVPQLVRGIFRDISERKRIEALLKQSYDQLELRIQQRTAQLEAEIVERKRSGEEIRLLQTITKAITEAPNFEEAIAMTLKKVCQTIGWNFAEAWIPDSQDLLLVPSSAWYGSIEQLQNFREASLENKFSRHTGLPGRVWATQQPEWTQDVSTQSTKTFLRAEVARKVGLKSALGVPVLANKKVIAVFVFFTFESCEEDKRMVDLVKSVVKQLGLFIERKRAEDALRSSMATNRALINAIPDWLLRINQEGTLVNFKETKDVCLLSNDGELLGKPIEEIFPSEVARLILNGVEQAMATAEVQILECQLSIADQWHDYEMRLAVSAENEVMAIVRDITQRKRSQEELRQQKELLAALLDNIPDVAWLKDREGRFIAVNEPFCHVCGLERNEILGYTDFEIFMPEFAQQSLEYDLAVMESGERKYIEETTFKSQGNSVWIETIITPIYDRDRQAIGTTGISRDITERKQIEEDMRNALEKEKQLNELKSRFVSMTSHEFRTPLATILSSAELIEYYGHKWSEEKKQQYLQKIQASVKHMTNLLNDVLVLGKGEAGKLEFMPKEIAIEPFCRELVEEVQLSTSSHQINLQVQEPYLQVSLDEKLLRHILTNLLTNAIKYSPGRDRVDFEVFYQSQAIVFRIRDYGIGVPESEQEKLFDSFHRASNVGNISGTGLGLAIVKKSVELHGGTIEISSQVGEGTTFTVTLPSLQTVEA